MRKGTQKTLSLVDWFHELPSARMLECKDFFPQDYSEPRVDTIKPDRSWEERRSLLNLTKEEKRNIAMKNPRWMRYVAPHGNWLAS